MHYMKRAEKYVRTSWPEFRRWRSRNEIRPPTVCCNSRCSDPVAGVGGVEVMTLFWVSWIQPTEDFRPLTDPPNDNVLGWWCSGYSSDESPILCAAVTGRNEVDTAKHIRKSWPELKDWRFCEPRPRDWTPGDRFLITKAWERKRFDDFAERGPDGHLGTQPAASEAEE